MHGCNLFSGHDLGAFCMSVLFLYHIEVQFELYIVHAVIMNAMHAIKGKRLICGNYTEAL